MISDQVTQAIENLEGLRTSEQISKCMNFVREMKDSGVLPSNQSVSPIKEGGLEQLELYALSTRI